MAIDQPSAPDSNRRLSQDEINLAKENLRQFRGKIREFLAERSGQDSEEITRNIESTPMPDPFE